ncbi:hypothetical protein Tco_1033789 [Tanacetum coccineum]
MLFEVTGALIDVDAAQSKVNAAGEEVSTAELVSAAYVICMRYFGKGYNTRGNKESYALSLLLCQNIQSDTLQYFTVMNGNPSSVNIKQHYVAILLRRKPALRCLVSRTSKYDESNAYALEDLKLQAGNPVNEVLIMNLPDHRNFTLLGASGRGPTMSMPHCMNGHAAVTEVMSCFGNLEIATSDLGPACNPWAPPCESTKTMISSIFISFAMRSPAMTASYSASLLVVVNSNFKAYVNLFLTGRATRVGSFSMYLFISSKYLSASFVHVKSVLSRHPFNVLKKGKDFSVLLDRNLLRDMSFSLRRGPYSNKIFWKISNVIKSNDQEGVADEEFSDVEEANNEDEQETAEIFRIETNLFDCETPLCTKFK